MSDIEGVCERCGLLLPEWNGNRRELCQCEKTEHEKRVEAFLETESAIVHGGVSENRNLIRVIGFMVLAGIGVWCGLAAFWFGLWMQGVCFMISGVLWCLVGLALLLMGEQK